MTFDEFIDLLHENFTTPKYSNSSKEEIYNYYRHTPNIINIDIGTSTGAIRMHIIEEKYNAIAALVSLSYKKIKRHENTKKYKERKEEIFAKIISYCLENRSKFKLNIYSGFIHPSIWNKCTPSAKLLLELDGSIWH